MGFMWMARGAARAAGASGCKALSALWQNGDSVTAHSFTSEDSVFIKDRGWVYNFGPEQIPEGMWDPCALEGIVEIDGHEHRVLGVETFAIARSPERPYRFNFGLLVREGPDG